MNITVLLSGRLKRDIRSLFHFATDKTRAFRWPVQLTFSRDQHLKQDTGIVPPKTSTFPWSLKRTLLVAFLVLAIVPLIIVTALSYVSSRNALREEIRIGLQRDAEVLIQDIDTLLFERVKDLVGWHRQEIMQDAAIGDVDKRLADLLGKIKTSYQGIYTQLYFLDTTNHIVASSSRDKIGQQQDIISKPWHTLDFAKIQVTIDQLQDARTFNTKELALHIPVTNKFSGDPLGELYSVLDWNEIKKHLQQAANAKGRSKSRLVFLIDQQGRFIDGSDNVYQWGFNHHSYLPPASSNTSYADLINLDDRHGHPKKFLACSVESSGIHGISSLGWRVIVAEPQYSAFLPVTQLLHSLLLILLLATFTAILVSYFLSRHISLPITRLSDFARAFDAQTTASIPQASGVKEVADLSHAFEEMIARLEKSRVQLIQASKLAAVGELAATMAHEVRTPLGILQSSAQILAEDQALSDEGQEMIEFILSESQRLDGLVTMMIECGRPKLPHFKSVDIHDTIVSVLDLLSQKINEKDLSIETALKARSSMIEADAEQLNQVIINLLLNAVQILPPGKKIWIKTQSLPPHTMLEIADNGPGIAPEERQRIFEPFVSHRSGGFGLGLSIVQQILQQHHATIKADERPGGGARFRITFKNNRQDKPS